MEWRDLSDSEAKKLANYRNYSTVEQFKESEGFDPPSRYNLVVEKGGTGKIGIRDGYGNYTELGYTLSEIR